MECQESEGAGEELLSLLSEATCWSEEETSRKLPTTLPRLTRFLQSGPGTEEGLQVVRFVFGSFLPHLNLDHDAYTLLKAASPLLKARLGEVLEGCVKGREEAQQASQALQEEAVLVLECCQLAVGFLLQAGEGVVEVGHVGDITLCVLACLTTCLTHCKDSEKLYEEAVTGVRQALGLLLQHCLSLLHQATSLLTRITTDAASEHDLDWLVTGSEAVCKCAVVLWELCEVRGCVVAWHTYASLVQRHSPSCLALRLDLGLAFGALAHEVEEGLQLLAAITITGASLEEKDRRTLQRVVKMSNFCLKVVVGLTERFQGYLRGAHAALLTLLLCLYSTRLQHFPEVVKGEVEQQVTIATEPLLAPLRDDDEFIKVVMEREDSAGDCGGEMLLLLSLLHPPTPASIPHTNDLITRLLAITDKSGVSLGAPCLVPGVQYGGRPQQQVSLYQHTVTQVCAALPTLTVPQMAQLEQDLVHWLLQGHVWAPLLASDLLCFIARYGSSELCLGQCEALAEVLPHTPPASSQRLLTASLLTRLARKLAHPHWLQLSSTLSQAAAECPALWVVVIGSVGAREEGQELFRRFLTACTSAIIQALTRNASGHTLASLCEYLESCPTVLSRYHQPSPSDPHLASFTKALLALWQRLPVEDAEKGWSCSTVLEKLRCGLVGTTAAIVTSLSTPQLLQVLSVTKEWCGHGTVGVAMCALLAAMGRCHIPSNYPTALTLIAEMLAGSLSSEEVVVQQAALEAFVTFGQHTPHEQVLPSSLVGCGPKVEEQVTRYLKQEPHPPPSGHTKLSLLQQQQEILQNNVQTSLVEKNFKKLSEPSDEPSELNGSGGERVSDVVAMSKHHAERTLEDGTRTSERCGKRPRPEHPEDSPPPTQQLLKALHQAQDIIHSMRSTQAEVNKDSQVLVKSLLTDLLAEWTEVSQADQPSGIGSTKPKLSSTK